MPYLNFETDDGRDALSKAISEKIKGQNSLLTESGSPINKDLIQAYRRPLHPPQTLDQFYYYSGIDTLSRDRDQVIYGYTEGNSTQNNSEQPEEPAKKVGRPLNQKEFPQTQPADVVEESKLEEPGDPLNDQKLRNDVTGQARVLAGGAQIDPGHSAENLHPFSAAAKPLNANRLENLSKIPRIFMVDQLWLWVIDEGMGFNMTKSHLHFSCQFIIFYINSTHE
jgi:hypothetical protein